MEIMKLYIKIFFPGVLLLANLLFADTYFVSTTGDNGQDGSEGAPWETVSRGNSGIGAGDTLIVLGNVDESGNTLEISVSGESAIPVVIMGQDQPVLRMRIRITGDHVVLQGFEIIGTDLPQIEVTGDHVSLLDNEVHGTNPGYNGGSSVVFNACANGTLRGGEVYRTGSVGFQGACTNLLIEGVEIYDQAWAIQSRNADGSDSITVARSHWHDIDNYGAVITGSSQNLYGISNVFFIEDSVTNCGQDNGYWATEAGSLFQRIDNIVVDRCRYTGNAYWGIDFYTCPRVTVRNSYFTKSHDDGGSPGINPCGLEINGCNRADIYNNVFVGNESNDPTNLFISYLESGHLWPPGPCTWNIYNNIIQDCTVWALPNDGTMEVNFYHNLFMSGRPWTDEAVAYFDDGNIYDADPLFVDPDNNDFRLQEGSPAIDAGLTLEEVPGDFFKRPRPAGEASDIGLHEFGAVARIAPSRPVPAAAPALKVLRESGTFVILAPDAGATIDFLFDMSGRIVPNACRREGSAALSVRNPAAGIYGARVRRGHRTWNVPVVLK
jgi:hypothetical protein